MEGMSKRELIARRIARELQDGQVVNLGIGIPTLVANYVPPGVRIWLQSENGFIGAGPTPTDEQFDHDLINASGQPVTLVPGGCFFDTAMSFAIIRGGHVDCTVLGALEVDHYGHLANWAQHGKLGPGIGGAMDLLTGARRVIVATEHVTRDGKPKLVTRCAMPLTATRQVSLVVTDMGVFEPDCDGFRLVELAPGVTPEDVRAVTGAPLIVPSDVPEMNIGPVTTTLS